ncbi:DUF4491 family protein [Clostridium kluyveri]|uniref:DUF4491 domain-containing protein n=2 Tax=Clostridium kluyveri TaxID=1534 RepID=A5N603_CLOK5|nr:DUF4491 family protein [Clostridium kluyveri]EDK32734.1 Conserved hypothetical protein [Clostridium kluyveri DSM 555]BAH05654.1 hypothetical protein CKR_0603 [Clostridium kluyveri NBRC 12016]
MFNYYGFIIGLFVLLLTGIGHVAVIKGEYYLGVRIWPIFLIISILSILISTMVKNTILSAFLGILGFTFLWGILELFKQKKRVEKGWFPKKNN